MSQHEFSNVTVVKKANVYFDGRVTSRTVIFPDGSRKTLGIMLPGEYTFDTGAPEVMEVLAGSMTVLLPGRAEILVQAHDRRSRGLLLLVQVAQKRAPGPRQRTTSGSR
jgi:hypothetical protein